MYSVKEMYYTLQGEGAKTGRAAVFCRFTGCNLWSGLEKDRIKAVCNFCDTDFVGTDGEGGGKFKTPEELSEQVFNIWHKHGEGEPYVVCTGGEPLLQLDKKLTRPDQTAVNGVHDYWDKFDSYKQYDEFTYKWLKESKRILKENGSYGSLEAIIIFTELEK